MMLYPQICEREMIQMTPKEELYWFWATGVLPRFMVDDLDTQKDKWSERPRRPINWLLLYLKQQGRHQPRAGSQYCLKKVY